MKHSQRGKAVLAKYQKPGLNVLKNSDFSKEPPLVDWEYPDSVGISRFPNEPDNPCALLLPHDTSFVRQLVPQLPPGKYLVAFRYLFRGDWKPEVRVRILVGGVFDSTFPLEGSPDDRVNYFFTTFDVNVGGGEFDLGLLHSSEQREFYLDDVVLAKLETPPGSVVKNGDFEEGTNHWTVSDHVGVHPVLDQPGTHNLVLGPAIGEDSSAEQLLDMSAAGAGMYLLSFTIIRLLANLSPAERGAVSLGEGEDHRIEFEFGEIGRYTLTFLFELTTEDIAQSVKLRIAKLEVKEEEGLDSWFIDKVALTRV